MKITPPDELPVAVDTGGGDGGSAVLVEGAILARREFGTRSILVGAEQDLLHVLSGFGVPASEFEVVHAPLAISADESPTRAVRRKPESTIAVSYSLIESGRASSVVSAGQSGATMAAGRLISGVLPGIERPAIATLLPVLGDSKPNVILDCGANVDSHAHHLVQFAVMGAVYYATLFGVERPKVGLLSNGVERAKGTDTLRAAFALLSNTQLVNFVGYIEGRDILRDAASVIVCDGFVGNVVLKSLEGCVRLIADELQHEAGRSVLQKMGYALVRDTYQRVFFEKFDYSAHGGAPLLGLRRVAMVLHGASDSRAIKNGIKAAFGFASQNLCEKLGLELANLDELMFGMDESGNVPSIGQRELFEPRSGWRLRKRSESDGSEEL